MVSSNTWPVGSPRLPSTLQPRGPQVAVRERCASGDGRTVQLRDLTCEYTPISLFRLQADSNGPVSRLKNQVTCLGRGGANPHGGRIAKTVEDHNGKGCSARRRCRYMGSESRIG